MLTLQIVYEYFAAQIAKVEGKEWLLLAIPLALTGTWTILKRGGAVVRNHVLAWQFQLSGEYLTFYGNPRSDDDSEERVRAKSVIRQKGTTVTIRAIEPSGRTWIHNGHIVRNRFVSGWYYPKAPYDDGVGTFFLEIKGAGKLEGDWHGYDYEGKKQIVSGKYTFLKKAKIQIADMSAKHFPRVLEIARQAFGDGYMTAADLSQSKAFGLVGMVDGQIVGFCLSMMLPKGDLDAFFHGRRHKNGALLHSDQNGTVGVIKSIAVDENRQNSGIGSQLIIAAQRRLFDGDASVLLVPVWHRKTGPGLQSIVELNGFNFLYEDRAYWKASCEGGKFDCVARKKEVCTCTCKFYVKTESAG